MPDDTSNKPRERSTKYSVGSAPDVGKEFPQPKGREGMKKTGITRR